MAYFNSLRRLANSSRAPARTALGKAFGAGALVLAALATSGGAAVQGPGSLVAHPTVSTRDAHLEVRSVELARREILLERIVASLADELSAEETAARQTGAVVDRALTQAGAAMPAEAELAVRESRQMAEAEALTAFTEARAADVEQAIRRVGLNPRLMLAKLGSATGQGGPLLALAGSGKPLDPRFVRLGASAARLTALRQAMDAIPNHLPARLEFISSPFGVRSDPLTGEPAVHAGLDFRGPIGAPIHAAASGTVTFAGDRGGYGNCLEITHGNGMVTRYAHMSAFRARVGEEVAAGDIVGAIGNTGRSTGPHLHFEVRINGEAVNPRRFLDANGAAHG